MRCAIYARVSTTDQTCENQLLELRRYAELRGWTATEYRDTGVSGSKTSRPALDKLMADAKRRRFDVLLVWRLDRLGRSLRHLVGLAEEFDAIGIALVSLGESIDTTSPAGRLTFHVLGALAEFERGRCRERILAGLSRARARGVRLGRKPYDIPDERFEEVAHLPLRKAAVALRVSKGVVQRWRLGRKPHRTDSTFALDQAAFTAAGGGK
jgi:DNA invertase Pin-like site-specific DNA recombinase